MTKIEGLIDNNYCHKFLKNVNIVLIFVFFVFLLYLEVGVNCLIFLSILFFSFLKTAKVYKIFSTKSFLFFLYKIFESFKVIIFNKIYLYPLLVLFIFSWISEIILFSSVMNYLKEIIIKKIKTKKDFENLIAKTIFFFFIDDYLASFAVKNLYYNFINFYGVSKEKFAYLISSNAPFMPTLFLISSWGSFLFSSLQAVSFSKNINEYSILVFSVPYFFYPIISILNSWIIRNFKISYGPMKKYEDIAEKNLKKINYEEYFLKNNSNKKNMYYFLRIFIYLIPFIFVLFSIFKKIFCIMLFSKNFMVEISKINFSEVMLYSSTKGFLLMIVILFLFRKLNFSDFFKTFIDTIKMLKSSVLTLVLAWVFLGQITSFLEIFNYAINLKKYFFLYPFLPFLVSLLSFCTSFIFSSSWGAISFLVPFLYFFEGICDLKIIFASIVSGAICGNNFSKNSDTNLIASNCAKAENNTAYNAQIYYSAPGIILSFISFFNYGIFSLFCSNLIALLITWSLNFLIIFVFFNFVKKRQKLLT